MFHTRDLITSSRPRYEGGGTTQSMFSEMPDAGLYEMLNILIKESGSDKEKNKEAISDITAEIKRRQSPKFAPGGSTDLKDEYKLDMDGNKVRVGDAIEIVNVSGPYGQTKTHQGIVSGFNQFGQVDLDGQERWLSYTPNYVHHDYEHGHHVYVKKIKASEIQDKLRVPKKFIPTFSSLKNVFDEKVVFTGTEAELKDFLQKKYPGSVWGQWNPLYNKGWRYINGNKVKSPEGKEYLMFDFYQHVEQGQGYLNELMIPADWDPAKQVTPGEQLKMFNNGGGVKPYKILADENPKPLIVNDNQVSMFETIEKPVKLHPRTKQPMSNSVPEVDIVIKRTIPFNERPKVTNSKSATEIFRKFWDTDRINVQESFWIMLLDRANNVIGIYNPSKGGIAATIVDSNLIGATALKSLAQAVIVCHNHPSGNLKFSDSDKIMTKKLGKTLKVLEIALLDSMVITETAYNSMADNSELPDFD